MASNTNVVQNVMFQRLDGKNILNVFHYLQESTDVVALVAADLIPFAARLKLLWAAGPLIIQADQISLTKVRLDILDISRLQPPPRLPLLYFPVTDRQDYTTGLPLAGGRATDYLPSTNAAKFQKVTGAVGRRKTGSSHFCAVCEVDTIGNRLDPAVVANYVTTYGPIVAAPVVFVNGGNTYNMNPVVLSITTLRRPPLGVGVSSSLVVTPITSATLNPVVGTMRRRKVRI